jgi:hypothetical protein
MLGRRAIRPVRGWLLSAVRLGRVGRLRLEESK